MLNKIICQLAAVLITVCSLQVAGHAHVQEGQQKGDFILTAQGLDLTPLDQSKYTCQITAPSILFKQKNKGASKTLTLKQFCSLWKKGHSFETNAPNATLVFSDQHNNSYQMIFEILMAHTTNNTLILIAVPLEAKNKKSFLKNNQPVSAKEFIKGTQTLKKETLSLLIDDAEGPNYDNPWDPS
mgnify:FL=1